MVAGRRLGIGVALALLVVLASRNVQSVAAETSEKPYIVLYVVIDSSASMKSSDPQDLRWTAVRMLASLLKSGDEIAILAFNSDDPSTPQQESAVTPFRGSADAYGPLIRIDRDVDKKTLLSDLDQFAHDNTPRNNTDMLSAFKSVEPLIRQARSDGRPYLIFLTDGLPYVLGWRPDVTEQDLTYEEALFKQVADLDVPVYAGGLWPKGSCSALAGDVRQGQRLLNRIVTVASDGQARCIDGASGLPEFFLTSFGSIEDRHYQRTDSSGRFEIREDQQGIIETLTLIYVKGGGGCDVNSQKPCVPILDPAGRELTSAAGIRQNNTEIWPDRDFTVISVRDPEAGTWLVNGDPRNTHVILQTRLRLAVTAPESGASRHPIGEPLIIRVRLFLESSDGHNVSLPEGYTPTFSVQSLQYIESSDSTEPATFNLVYDPSTDSYVARTLPLDKPGAYSVVVEAELGDFKIAKAHRVNVELFPRLRLEGIASNVIELPRGQMAELGIVPNIDERIEPITDLVADYARLHCNNQQVTPTLRSLADGTYKLVFTPPQQDISRCELEVEGIVKHLGTPYRVSLGPIAFSVRLQSELRLEVQNKEFGELLPFEELVITGTHASLFSDNSVALAPSLSNDSFLDVRISPEIILPGEDTPLVFILTPKPNAPLKYGHYAGTIKVESSPSILISGGAELRYGFDLVQPSVTHDVEKSLYSLEQPMATLGDESTTVSFTLAPHTPITGSLHVSVIDETGRPLIGVVPELNTTVIPVEKAQTYVLRLRSTDVADPWPPDLLQSRPITFSVVLRAEPDMRVLPSDTFRVNGTRLAGLHAWWLQTTEFRALLARLGLVIGGIWFVAILGWAIVIREQHPSPNTYLIWVRIAEGGNSLIPQGRMALSKYGRLKHRLFGIGFRFGSHRDVPRPRWRLFPPSAFWCWLLRANTADYVEAGITSHAAEFRLWVERGFTNSQLYKLLNVGETPVGIHKSNRGLDTVKPGEDLILRGDDVVLTEADRGFQLAEMGHVTTRVGESRPTPRIGADVNSNMSQVRRGPGSAGPLRRRVNRSAPGQMSGTTPPSEKTSAPMRPTRRRPRS
jgi:hypothetical protein